MQLDHLWVHSMWPKHHSSRKKKRLLHRCHCTQMHGKHTDVWKNWSQFGCNSLQLWSTPMLNLSISECASCFSSMIALPTTIFFGRVPAYNTVCWIDVSMQLMHIYACKHWCIMHWAPYAKRLASVTYMFVRMWNFVIVLVLCHLKMLFLQCDNFSFVPFR